MNKMYDRIKHSFFPNQMKVAMRVRPEEEKIFFEDLIRFTENWGLVIDYIKFASPQASKGEWGTIVRRRVEVGFWE